MEAQPKLNDVPNTTKRWAYPGDLLRMAVNTDMATRMRKPRAKREGEGSVEWELESNLTNSPINHVVKAARKLDLILSRKEYHG